LNHDDTDAEPDTAAASGSDDTAAAPTEHVTELIETGAAPTPELAWSAAAEEQATEAISEKRSRALWLVPVTALLVAGIAVASALLFYTHRAPATSTRAPAAPALDGTYRLDVDLSRQMINGAAVPQPNAKNTSWWAFRSSCKPTGCVATGTGLNKDNHQVADTPAVTAEFHFMDGHWQAVPFQRHVQMHGPCLGANGEIVAAGVDTYVVTYSMEPQRDGNLRGTATDTVLSNECVNQGQVLQAPFVASRTGDQPASVTVADPATVNASPPTSAPFPPVVGQALDGIFRVDFDYANQTVNGVTGVNSPPNESIWWAFRSTCSMAGCVATGVALASENPAVKRDGTVRATDVLHFADGHWQDTASLRPRTKCPGATNGTTADNDSVSWSLEAKPGGTLQGIETFTVLTSECGDQGTVYRTPISATRLGDVPPTVTLADPSLFEAPPVPTTNGPR
jgi:serine/threonine protein kinase, bacterial